MILLKYFVSISIMIYGNQGDLCFMSKTDHYSLWFRSFRGQDGGDKQKRIEDRQIAPFEYGRGKWNLGWFRMKTAIILYEVSNVWYANRSVWVWNGDLHTQKVSQSRALGFETVFSLNIPFRPKWFNSSYNKKDIRNVVTVEMDDSITQWDLSHLCAEEATLQWYIVKRLEHRLTREWATCKPSSKRPEVTNQAPSSISGTLNHLTWVKCRWHPWREQGYPRLCVENCGTPCEV